MSEFTGWTWDPTRLKYYYFSQERGGYVYQDETVVLLDGSVLAAEAGSSSNTRNIPRKVETNPEDHTFGGHEDDTKITSVVKNYGIVQESDGPPEDGGQTYGAVSAYQPSEFDQSNLSHRLDQLKIGPVDPKMVKKSIPLNKEQEAARDQELDKSFQPPKDPEKYFTFGRVFRAFWAEPAGRFLRPDQGTRDRRFGRNVASKIQWFVVVKTIPDARHCLCLPINTFSERGVTSPKLLPQYSIIYASKEKPLPLPHEDVEGMPGLQRSIRVDAAKHGNKMNKISRVCYGKMYTVEFYNAVQDFGKVHKDHLGRLEAQWKKIFELRLHNVVPDPEAKAEDEDENEDDELVDDEDEDEEENQREDEEEEIEDEEDEEKPYYDNSAQNSRYSKKGKEPRRRSKSPSSKAASSSRRKGKGLGFLKRK